VSLITIIWSVCAGICLALAGVNVLVWLRARDQWANLFFSLGAAGAAATAVIELALMHAQTAAESGLWLRWLVTSVTVIVIALIWFVRAYLGAGNLWLAWLTCGLRALVSVINFLPGRPNIVFREMNPPRQIMAWGESVSVPDGIGTSWTLLVTGSSVVFLVYLAGAVIAAWRQGNRRRAAWLGGAISLGFLLGMTQTRLVAAGALPIPFTFSMLFLPIVLFVGIELSSDLVRTFVLSRDLRESQERMQLATSAADLGVWDWDIAQSKIWATDTIRRRLGVGPAEPVDFDRFLQSVHPDDRELVERAVHGAIDGDREFQAEYRVITPDGATRWIAARGRVARSPSGKPLHLRGISMDISERKRAEAEAGELRRELAQVQRASTLGLLASSLAHEINQPLGAILRNAEAAELFLQRDPPDLEELRAIIVDIRQDNQRAGAVIDRLRSLLRRRELNLEAVSLEELLDQVVLLIRPELQARQARLDVRLPPSLAPVMGDRVHLQQVLLNLLVNGLGATSGLPSKRRRLVLTARCVDDRTVEVAVGDSGCGIPEEQLARVFEPFFTSSTSGLGVGLAICRTIIESHGGRIWAENNANGGATLRFTLKIAEHGGAP